MSDSRKECVKESNELRRKMPDNSVHLQFAGDLILAHSTLLGYNALFRRYQTFFEFCANLPRQQRLILYKMFNALVLTSHARRLDAGKEKQLLFALKNDLYFDLVKDKKIFHLFNFSWLKSGKILVKNKCAKCEMDVARKFCQFCETDKIFFDVLAMEYKTKEGFWRIFLSSELGKDLKIQNLGYKNRKGVKEFGLLHQYHYHSQNLCAVDLSSSIRMQAIIIDKHF